MQKYTKTILNLKSIKGKTHLFRTYRVLLKIHSCRIARTVEGGKARTKCGNNYSNDTGNTTDTEYRIWTIKLYKRLKSPNTRYVMYSVNKRPYCSVYRRYFFPFEWMGENKIVSIKRWIINKWVCYIVIVFTAYIHKTRASYITRQLR